MGNVGMWLEVGPTEHAHTGWTPALVVAERTFVPRLVDKPVEPRPENAASLQQLFRRDLRMLLTLVRRVVRRPSDAEDIVQDAFLRVWRAMEAGLVRSPRAVLFKTAHNLALNHVRNPRNHVPDPATGADEAILEAPTAEEQMIVEEDLDACRQAFAQLPLRCREALTLRVVDELSYKEMSERLGLSVSTLEKHYIRGRRLCRDMLREERGASVRRKPEAGEMLAAAE
jgi:RNA polymerase sigma factor (sigma-70 family)